jgi:hypothetical protein
VYACERTSVIILLSHISLKLCCCGTKFEHSSSAQHLLGLNNDVKK